jgi:hypothetical protein
VFICQTGNYVPPGLQNTSDTRLENQWSAVTEHYSSSSSDFNRTEVVSHIRIVRGAIEITKPPQLQLGFTCFPPCCPPNHLYPLRKELSPHLLYT